MAMSKADFSLKPLRDALSSLEEIVNEPENKVIRDAVIQRFEYTFELSWKTLKRYFELNNKLREENVKNIFREAGKQGLIESVEQWFGFLHARNLTSHTYSEKVAVHVYSQAKMFAPQARLLLRRLEPFIE